MHELAIAQSILKSLIEKTKDMNLKKVGSIQLRVGRINLIHDEPLQEAFDLVAKDTVFEGTRLDIEEVEGAEITVLSVEGK